MKLPVRPVHLIALPLAAAGLVFGCGGGDTSSDASEVTAQFAAPTTAAGRPKDGGSLTVLAASDVDNIDPGATYYQFGYMVTDATQTRAGGLRPRRHRRPAAARRLRADGLRRRQDDHLQAARRRQVLAAGQSDRDLGRRQVRDRAGAAAGGRQRLRPDLLEGHRRLRRRPQAGAERSDRRRARHRRHHDARRHDAGDQAHRHDLDRRGGRAVAAGLGPGAEEYAKPYDAENPSTYGTHQVATGPVHDRERLQRRATGYTPNKEIHLVRNPNWEASDGDYRPAYLDEITIQEGFADTVSARQEDPLRQRRGQRRFHRRRPR